MPGEQEISDELPDEEVMTTLVETYWKMYFDGAAKTTGSGVGIVFISPQKDILPYSFYLGKVCTNNAAEYEALIMGLELALKFKIRHIEIFGDSELVIKQMTTEYEVRHEGLAMYHDLAQRLFECFPDASITHVPRKDNAIADALANLATALATSGGQTVTVTVEERAIMLPIDFGSGECDEITQSLFISCMDIEVEDWQQPYIEYLRYGRLPENPQERERIRRSVGRYTYLDGALYRKAFDGMLLRCVSGKDTQKIVAQAHSSECGGHISGQRLHRRIKHMGYVWPSMAADALAYAKSCQARS